MRALQEGDDFPPLSRVAGCSSATFFTTRSARFRFGYFTTSAIAESYRVSARSSPL